MVNRQPSEFWRPLIELKVPPTVTKSMSAFLIDFSLHEVNMTMVPTAMSAANDSPSSFFMEASKVRIKVQIFCVLKL